MMAFTFHDSIKFPKKGGGTDDTWKKCTSVFKVHVPLPSLQLGKYVAPSHPAPVTQSMLSACIYSKKRKEEKEESGEQTFQTGS